MHELTVATNIVNAVAEEIRGAPSAPAARRLVVRVGMLSGVDPEALRFCLGVAADGAELAGLAVAVETVPATLRCPACGPVPAETGFSLACPRCGGRVAETEGGRELEVWLDDEDRPDETGPRGE